MMVAVHSTPVASVWGVGRAQIEVYVPRVLLPTEHDRCTVNGHQPSMKYYSTNLITYTTTNAKTAKVLV